jgi:hypothetical protein
VSLCLWGNIYVNELHEAGSGLNRAGSIPLSYSYKHSSHTTLFPLLTHHPHHPSPSRHHTSIPQPRPLRLSFSIPLSHLSTRLSPLHSPSFATPLSSGPTKHPANHMPTNRSFFSQFIGSLIGFRPRSPSSGTPIKPAASPFSTSSPRRRSTSSLNSAGSGGGGATTGVATKDREAFNGEKWWIGGRRADGSERYYPIAPLRYHVLVRWDADCRRYRSTDRISL